MTIPIAPGRLDRWTGISASGGLGRSSSVRTGRGWIATQPTAPSSDWRGVPGSPNGSHRTPATLVHHRRRRRVPLRDVQEAASHADPRTTMRYDRSRQSLDRHATYIVAAFVAGAAFRTNQSVSAYTSKSHRTSLVRSGRSRSSTRCRSRRASRLPGFALECFGWKAPGVESVAISSGLSPSGNGLLVRHSEASEPSSVWIALGFVHVTSFAGDPRPR